MIIGFFSYYQNRKKRSYRGTRPLHCSSVVCILQIPRKKNCNGLVNIFRALLSIMYLRQIGRYIGTYIPTQFCKASQGVSETITYFCLFLICNCGSSQKKFNLQDFLENTYLNGKKITNFSQSTLKLNTILNRILSCFLS